MDFRAAAGVTVLFGPSGSGKTMLLDSIAGFVRPDEGPHSAGRRHSVRRRRGRAPVAAGPQLRLRVPELRPVPAHDPARESGVRGGAPSAPGTPSPRERNARALPPDRSRRTASARGFRRPAPALLHRARFDRRAQIAAARRARARPGRAAAGGVLRNRCARFAPISRRPCCW